MVGNDKARIGTRAVWGGESGPAWEGSTQIPVAHSVSFGYDDLDEWAERISDWRERSWRGGGFRANGPTKKLVRSYAVGAICGTIRP
jgi:hypothetical protein